jgi:hypothetical protein
VHPLDAQRAVRGGRPTPTPTGAEIEPGGAAIEHRGVTWQDRHDGDRSVAVRVTGRRHHIGRAGHDQRPVVGAGELRTQPSHDRARHRQVGIDRRIEHHRDHLDRSAAQVETDAAAVTADPELRPPMGRRRCGTEAQQIVSELDRTTDRDRRRDDR